jgi:hypothetical protein
MYTIPLPIANFLRRYSLGKYKLLVYCQNKFNEQADFCSIVCLLFLSIFMFVIFMFAVGFALQSLGTGGYVLYLSLFEGIHLSAAFGAWKEFLNDAPPSLANNLFSASSEVCIFITCVIAALAVCLTVFSGFLYGAHLSRKLTASRNEFAQRTRCFSANPAEPSFMRIWFKQLKEKTCFFIKIV